MWRVSRVFAVCGCCLCVANRRGLCRPKVDAVCVWRDAVQARPAGPLWQDIEPIVTACAQRAVRYAKRGRTAWQRLAERVSLWLLPAEVRGGAGSQTNWGQGFEFCLCTRWSNGIRMRTPFHVTVHCVDAPQHGCKYAWVL